jgi:hypothetical protein
MAPVAPPKKANDDNRSWDYKIPPLVCPYHYPNREKEIKAAVASTLAF